MILFPSIAGRFQRYNVVQKMKRFPESDLPMPRASLPEGCSDLIDAYRIRAKSQEDRERLLLRLAAQFHDSFLEQLDTEVLLSGDQLLLAKKISDFLHPILLAHRDLEGMIRPSSDLVDTLMHVVLANLEVDES
jgi:hypothetical protein